MDAAGYEQGATSPGLQQEQLKYNPLQHLTLSGVPNESIFQNVLACISKDVYFSKGKMKGETVFTSKYYLRLSMKNSPKSTFFFLKALR